MIKGSTQEDDITFINIYALNIGAPKYIKQILSETEEETDSNTIIVGDFNTPFTSVDRSFRQKIDKETLALNDTLIQIDFTDIYRIFHSKRAEYTFFFKCTWNILQDRSHVSPQNKSQ